MQEHMIVGESLNWSNLLDQIKKIQELFNQQD